MTGLLPVVTLNPNSSIPRYRQLYEWFRFAIVTGVLRPGQRVPSTRVLASEVGVSRITALNAYEQLHAEGYLESFAGSGTYVASSIPDDLIRPIRDHTANETIPKMRGEKHPIAEQEFGHPSEKFLGAFRTSLPSLEHFPLTIWSTIIARHCRNATRSQMAYGDPMGLRAFRETVAEYLRTTRGVTCDASQIMIVHGSQQALELSARVLIRQGDSVWMEEPGYKGARLAFQRGGATLVPVPVDDQGLNVKKGLEHGQKITLAYTTPSHQYPLGATLSAARRMTLLDWAARNKVWLIEDDYDSEYRYGTRPIASIQGMDQHGRVIYIGTFSKVLYPALRVGYMVLPRALIASFSAEKEASDLFSPTLTQSALTEFIKEGHFARHIRRMRVLYAGRRKILIRELERQVGETVKIIGEQAGMHLVLLFPTHFNDERISRTAAQAGISVMPLSHSYITKHGQQGLVLGFGGVNERDIPKAVKVLARVIQSEEARG